MKFGICADLLNAPQAAAAGFGYIEGAMTSVALAGDEAFGRMREALESSGIRAGALNVMLPGSFRLTGPDADLAPVLDYLEKGFERAALLGTRVQVFGSGTARNVPDGFPMPRAMEQLAEFLRLAAPIAAKHGIRIAVEPLNPGECNIVNTVEDALSLVRLAAVPEAGVLADWYHMAAQGEGTSGMLAARDRLLHCHIANPAGRRFPMPGDGADFAGFFSALKQIGYGAGISVEGSGSIEEYPQTLARLKGCL